MSNQTSRYRFRATTYSMGRAAESVEFEDTVRMASRNPAIKRLRALGLPGTGRGAAAQSQVVGVKRLEAV